MTVFNNHLFIISFIVLLTNTGIVSSGNITFARISDDDDQSSCYNNLLQKLPNESFTASSVWKSKPEFGAHQARMSTLVDIGSNSNGEAWCPDHLVSLQASEWLEIDLGDLKLISSFFIMGRGEGNFKEFVSFFYLEYQRQRKKWIRYKNEQNKELLIGNGDSRNRERIQFHSPFVARKIRIYPISQGTPSWACMKIRIYGCNFNDGVIEYSMPQGHLHTFNTNEIYDFRDLTYDCRTSLNSTTHYTQLSGGLGQLMDNVIYQGILIKYNKNIHGIPFVGWSRKIIQSNEIEITFKFDQIRQLTEIRFFALNMIQNDIGVFASVFVHFSIGGEIYDSIAPPYFYQTITNRRVYYSRWINIPIQATLTRYVKINIMFELEWIVLSEIILISEKSDDNIAVEINAPRHKWFGRINMTTKKATSRNMLSVSKTSKEDITIKRFHKDHESLLFIKTNFGFGFTLASGIIGILLLFTIIIFGFISLRQHHRRFKKKSRYSTYTTRTNGGPYIGDSLVVPLTAGTHNSSGAGSVYSKRQGSADLGLSYPIMGKEYMTLSSKSGTDYDMAGCNSLDGLIPIFKDSRHSVSTLFQNAFVDYPYTIQTNSVPSNDGSSYTEYATTSLYRSPQLIENSHNSRKCIQPGFFYNNLLLHPIGPTLSAFDGFPYTVQSPTPSAQRFVPGPSIDMFTKYSPYRQVPSFITPTTYNMFPEQYVTPVTSWNPLSSVIRDIAMPPLQGICGNALSISIDDNLPQPSTVSLTNILSNLTEINPREIEYISTIGCGEHGSIGFIRTLHMDQRDRNNIPLTITYLSKSIIDYSSKNIRNEIVREMSVQCSIKHSAFLQLLSYAFERQESGSIKYLKLSFLFQIDGQMDNLYTFLRQQSTINASALELSRGQIVYNRPLTNLSKASNMDMNQLYPSVPSLLYISSQIAKGMLYLESHNIVHRDVAARNCFVSANLIVKITDIAMAMPIFSDHYVEYAVSNMQLNECDQINSSLSVGKQKFPLQWMAFETILQGSYSVKTDVWSFGVTMWEIFNRCQKPPYGEFGIIIERIMENANHLSMGSQAAVLPSSSLSRLSCTSQNEQSSIFKSNIDPTKDLSDLVRECWHRNPLQRPSFDNICLYLEQKLSNFDKKPS